MMFRLLQNRPSDHIKVQYWNLQVYLLQVLHLFIWNLTLLLTGGPSFLDYAKQNICVYENMKICGGKMYLPCALRNKVLKSFWGMSLKISCMSVSEPRIRLIFPTVFTNIFSGVCPVAQP